MSVVKVVHHGNFRHIEAFFKRSKDLRVAEKLSKIGEAGVAALSATTPRDTGLTASLWSYELHSDGDGYKIIWMNSNVNRGVNIALILQLGHGTRNGGYVEGIDYINPALQPVFQEFADELWEEVTRP